MKTVEITEATEIAGKKYFAGTAVVSDDEATALDDAGVLDGEPEEFVVPATEQSELLENIPQPNVPALGATTVITAVPGAFADEAAVQTYLDEIIPIIEGRLDDIEGSHDTIVEQLETAGIFEPA